MMSVEGPFISALIARMPEPKYNLAAYGVAFAFALIVEAPIIMMLSASTALAKDYSHFKKLRNFTYTLNYFITGVMLLLLIPDIFFYILESLVGLEHKVAELTHIGLAILLPWPGMIGYRRFYQGILISNDQTKKVAYGTIVRLISMSVTALSLYLLTKFDGIIIGASALSAGVSAEAIATKIMARNVLRKMKNEAKNEIPAEELTYKYIINFYYPLALMSAISLAVQPIVTFFLGKSYMPLESLAVLPVVHSFVFIFRSFGLSFHEAGVAMMGENFENYNVLKNFSALVGSATVLLLGIISFTPLSDLWMHVVSGLSSELTGLTKLPLEILFLLPGLTFLISFQRAVLVNAKHTQPITTATIIEVAGIILIMWTFIANTQIFGAAVAGLAFIIGRLSANTYLFKPYLKVIKRSRN